jgi:hypothetical protein
MLLNAERRAQVVRLLETRDEYLPVLRAPHASPAGFVSGVRVRSCPDCLANGRTMFGCETCGGRGTVEAGRLVRVALTDEWRGQSSRLDPYAVEVTAPYGFDPTRHERVRERELEVGRLGQQTRSAAAVDEDVDAAVHPFGWERERARRWAEFDYGALDAALEALREFDGTAFRVLHAVFVYGWLEGGPERIVERGLVFLAAALPDPLRAPPADKTGLRGMVGRDAAIRRLIIGGASTARTAEEFGLSVSQVNRVVAAGDAG